MEQDIKKTSGIARRGFASLTPEQRKNIASKGGYAAHKKGTAHKFSSDEARLAGRKGGEATSRNKAHMAEIGKKGGEASRNRNNQNMQPAQDINSEETQPNQGAGPDEANEPQ